jgi:hypothetical protein
VRTRLKNVTLAYSVLTNSGLNTDSCFMLIPEPASLPLLVIEVRERRGGLEFVPAFDSHWSREKDGFNEVYDVPVRLSDYSAIPCTLDPSRRLHYQFCSDIQLMKTVGFSKQSRNFFGLTRKDALVAYKLADSRPLNNFEGFIMEFEGLLPWLECSMSQLNPLHAHVLFLKRTF